MEGGAKPPNDAPFTLEIYIGDTFHPICLAAGDDNMVTAMCEAVGFPDGGHLIENMGKIHIVDALPVLVQSTPSLVYFFALSLCLTLTLFH